MENEIDDIHSSYVNGRIDFERKNGTIGNVNYGKLSSEAAKKAAGNPFGLMKGKKRLAKLRKIFQHSSLIFEIAKDGPLPVDTHLSDLAKSYLRK